MTNSPSTPPTQALTGQQLPPELATALQRELKPNDLLIWTGQPDPHRYSKRGLLYYSLFYAVSAGLLAIIALMFAGSEWHIEWQHALLYSFLLSFVIFVVVMAVMPIWKRHAAARILYAVTHRQIIVWTNGFVESSQTRHLESIRHHEDHDGYGQITFIGQPTPSGDRFWMEFLDVPNVRAVETLIHLTLIPPQPTN